MEIGLRVQEILGNIKKKHICSFREENLSEKEKAEILYNLEKNRDRVIEGYKNRGGGIPNANYARKQVKYKILKIF